MYILFPIGIMYYFGTNLDGLSPSSSECGYLLNSSIGRFKVDGFWPKEGQTHKIPFEKEEIQAELERLKSRRLAIRAERLQSEAAAARAQESATSEGH
jgi:protein PET100, fungi type